MQNTSIKILFYDIIKLIKGPKTAKLISENIGTKLIDLLFFSPYKAIDALYCNKWEELENKKKVLLKVRVNKHYKSFKYTKAPYRITVYFDKKIINLVFFSKFTGYLNKIYKENTMVFITGTLVIYGKKFQIMHPEIVKSENINNKNILIKLIYRQKGGLKSTAIQKAILNCVKYVPDLKEWNKNLLYCYKNIPKWDVAIKNLHLAEDTDILKKTSPTFIRLAYDEMLAKQLSLEIIRQSISKEKSNYYTKDSTKIIKLYINNLPFKLTKNQKIIYQDIIKDLNSKNKMLRLLHGDVGSGKTVVAIISALHVIKSGYQVALMAPTELLAKQHYTSVKKIFENLSYNVALLTSSSENKGDVLKNIKTHKINLVIGTHALIQKNVNFYNLSYVIIDEQHRFGVEQRLKIRNKGQSVDMLILSATPIPRTLMLATLGDISVSTLKQKPFNNTVKTILKSENNLNDILVYIDKEIKLNNKIFWICPTIEEKDEKSQSYSVEERYRLIKNKFKNVGLLHGKLDPNKKEQILNEFRDSKIKILISTVVIEVGIDIPDANIIIIDNSNKFGLAQIHQLRGRVGRGKNNGVCILLYKEPLNENSLNRLKILKTSNNGFEIAESDLLMRGGGDELGKKQYGFEEFKFFDILYHKNLIELSIKEANEIISLDPHLSSSRGLDLINLLYIHKKDKAINLISAG